MNDLHLILVDPNPALCRAFQKAFHRVPDVEVIQGYFERLPAFDCMVSAANSFGLMDGGVDAAIVNFFGDGLMARVQQRILDTSQLQRRVKYDDLWIVTEQSLAGAAAQPAHAADAATRLEIVAFLNTRANPASSRSSASGGP